MTVQLFYPNDRFRTVLTQFIFEVSKYLDNIMSIGVQGFRESVLPCALEALHYVDREGGRIRCWIRQQLLGILQLDERAMAMLKLVLILLCVGCFLASRKGYSRAVDVFALCLVVLWSLSH